MVEEFGNIVLISLAIERNKRNEIYVLESIDLFLELEPEFWM